MKLCHLVVLLGLASSGVSVSAETPAESCKRDLAYIPGFLLENDTGAPAHWENHGRDYFERVMADAMAKVEGVGSKEECRPILSDYLKRWRKGHLFVNVARAQTKSSASAGGAGESKHGDGREPSLELLSDKTALLTIPSFRVGYRAPLEELLAEHIEQLEACPNWIIDLRRNDGGSDNTANSLLEWLFSDQLAQVTVEWRVTAANIRAQRETCDYIGTTADWCRSMVQSLVEHMEKAPLDSYVSTDSDTIKYLTPPERDPDNRPKRVAILTGKGCGSACEQVLLAARQSFRVKLVGRPSAGILDYSNLRPHTLPSGNFRLLYATSRSRRLPDMPVDTAGVMPDIYLPKPKNEEERRAEVLQVQSWLETGGFVSVNAQISGASGDK